MTGNLINHGKCLTDETLTDYLEGTLDPAFKAASEAHLVSCDTCRVRLAFFMRLLREDVRPAEFAALRIIEDKWSRAQSYRGFPNRGVGNRRRWKIASGGVAAVLLIAFGTRVAIEHIGEPRSAGEVIQLLLSESRPFE